MGIVISRRFIHAVGCSTRVVDISLVIPAVFLPCFEFHPSMTVPLARTDTEDHDENVEDDSVAEARDREPCYGGRSCEQLSVVHR